MSRSDVPEYGNSTKLLKMDGFASAKEHCAALPKRPLVIAVTGHAQTAVRAKREGFDLHFVKPVDPSSLIDMRRGTAHSELVQVSQTRIK